MVAEAGHAPSGWTLETLLLHVDREIEHFETLVGDAKELTAQRFDGLDRAVQIALTAQQEAVQVALTAMDRRLNLLNEFRAQLADVIATLMRRDEALQRIDTNADKITQLDRSTADRIGKLELLMRDYMPRAEADKDIAGLNEAINRLDKKSSESAGKGAGLSFAWGLLVSAFALLAAIVAVYSATR